jgi:hypothetical protein
VTRPNLGEAFLRVAGEIGRWRTGLRLTADGADVASTAAELPSEREACDAAFELFRNRVIT